MNKRITFVVSSMGRGGAERVVSLLSSHYVELGYDVEIIMTLHNILEYKLDSRVVITNLSNDLQNRIFYLPKMLFKLRKHISGRRPDVVLAFMDINALFTNVALLGKRVYIVASERNDPTQVKNKMLRKLYIWAYASSNRVVVQTKRVFNYFPQKVQKHASIIGNPISVGGKAIETSIDCIVAVGRLEKQKNHEMLIRSFAMISDEYPNATLRIYGDGSLRQYLQEMINTLGLSNRVFLMGTKKDIHNQIKDAKIFALSSDFEGLSNAMLEAMMMGIPVVSTDCAGADEVIINDINGLLSPVGDAKKFSENLSKILSDNELQRKMSIAAAESVSKFKEETIFEKWDELICI